MKFLYILSFVLLSNFTYAQELKATVQDLSFMSGRWTQNHEWGDMEEIWGKPAGNCMASSFRCVKDGKVIFYEFVVIEQGPLVPVLKMRHFNAGSIAWEEKDAPIHFPLIQLSTNKALFESTDKSLKMTYDVVPGKQMKIILEEKDKTGKWSTTQFDFVYNKD